LTKRSDYSQARATSSLLQAALKDDTGQKYNVDLLASSAAKKDGSGGELAPGERARRSRLSSSTGQSVIGGELSRQPRQ
jgi:hypothetical protein